MGGKDKRGKLRDDRRLGEISGVIDEGFPLLMREEAEVRYGRKGDKRKLVMIRGGGR